MTKLKSRMAGVMAGLLCIMSILQPLPLYASGEETEPEPVRYRVSQTSGLYEEDIIVRKQRRKSQSQLSENKETTL